MRTRLHTFFKTIYPKRKGQIISFFLFLFITIAAFYPIEPIPYILLSGGLSWAGHIFLYFTLLMGFSVILGNKNILVAILELPISAFKILLPEIVIILSIIYFFTTYISIVLLFFLYYSEINIYIILFGGFLGIKLFGGFIVKRINVNIFGMKENATVPIHDFSDMTNAAFYLFCTTTIVYNDIQLLATSSEEYNWRSIFLMVILAYLTFDNALPILKNGLQSIFNMKKIKRRYLRFICDLKHVKKRIKVFFFSCKVIVLLFSKFTQKNL